MKIEKGIPIPPDPKPRGWGLAALLREMVPGDSVFIKNRKPRQLGGAMQECRIKGWVMVKRSEGTGTRVWRIK